MKFNQNFEKLDLQGKWQFAFSDKTINASSIKNIKKSGLSIFDAHIPGNFELDLLSNNIIPDPYFGTNIKILREYEKMHIYYFREFEFTSIPETDSYLVFEGLDCIADIFINGKLVFSADNMMISHEFLLESILTTGTNEIVVAIKPPGIEALKYEYPVFTSGFQANYESLYIRKPAHMFGWDILPRIISAGVFRPIYIEFRNKVRFTEAYLQTSSLSNDSAESVFFYKCLFDKKPGDVWKIKLSGQCNDSEFSDEFILSFQYGKNLFNIKSPRLWNTRGRGLANIYSIKADLIKNNEIQASVNFTHGIRTIELLREGINDINDSGEFTFIVNGEKIFVKGTNWVPADALHSRDKERIPSILEMAADLNCNIIRCWGGNLYEDDIFYDICDREGILIWQDFAMACAIYPQDIEFQSRLYKEASSTIRRLRQHPCLALWAGDNECDQAYSWFGFDTDPNTNILTRGILPDAVRQHDPFRSYLPSSPYIDSTSYGKGDDYLPENHLWGIRDYFKSDYYAKSTCLFASEMGYHGCPSPESITKFISADSIWPYDNEEWLLHSTSPLPEIDKRYNFRVELMANQIKVLFGKIPDNLEDFSYASQISQGEAKKFFIELFRCDETKRTGIIWWNLMDGWPQFSDAIVDYYFNKKLAYDYIKRSQRDILLTFREPVDNRLNLICSNLNMKDNLISYSVTDADTGKIILQDSNVTIETDRTTLGSIEYDENRKALYIIRWKDSLGKGINHYLAGPIPFDLDWYRKHLKENELL